MKLSGKGLANVFYHQSLDLDIDSYDFKPEDFTGAVVLTVEEAKAIAVTMFALHKFCQKFLSGVNDNFLIKASKVNHVLDKRIEQAEVQDEAE